jgi:signal transduction histidine kinase
MNGVRRRPGPGRRGLGLAWREDLALPVVVGLAQLAGTLATAGHLRYQQRNLTANLVLHQSCRLSVLDWMLLAIGPVALVARRRHPVAAAWLACTATLAPSPLWFAYLSLTVAFTAAATSGHRRAAWAVITAAYVSSLWLAPLIWGRPAASAATALLVAAWLAVLVVAAEAIRMRRERGLAARTAVELDSRNRASEERLRMARELHDVIGHHISLINVQAGVGLDLMDAQPEQARAALAAVRTVSRQALDELRAMLSALREAGEEAPRSPAPGLARLPDLIARTGAAGLAVTTDVAGVPRVLPTAVELAAYRIVQESLTNVARHAGPASVSVRIGYGEHDLSIEVTDDGCPAAGHTVTGNSAGGQRSRGAGTGIPGMRERAAALGGRLDAGSRPDGGFGVHAVLPLGAAADGSAADGAPADGAP